jgi:predicted nucleic acid-binding protein
VKIVLVTGASVLVPGPAFDDEQGVRVRHRLRGQELTAPEVVDLECACVLRGLVRAGKVAESRARTALRDLRNAGMERVAHAPRLDRILELRDNVSAYGAAYVALAESLDATLLTADAGLACAPGLRCTIELLIR